MTRFSIERLPFDKQSVKEWGDRDPRHRNWPVVYVIDGQSGAPMKGQIYVGETVNAASRMRQHLDGGKKGALQSVRVVVDDTFNKSACLDLESHLIRWLAGDGQFTVLNGNEGITDAAYYDRELYRESFRDVFEELRVAGVFERTIPEIENSDLFKLSPFKALTTDQAVAIEAIVEGLLDDLHTAATTGETRRSRSVVQGHPGTGKTIVAIFLLKLLADIKASSVLDDVDPDSMFSEFFTDDNRALLADFRMGLVIPQQSLRKSVQNVFKKTPGLDSSMVLSPFDVGGGGAHFDLLIVDETHRLNVRANQSSGVRNKQFADNNVALYGADDATKTQLDWIADRSSHQILLVDAEQAVRPADLLPAILTDLVRAADMDHRLYRLASQMRVKAGADYVEFVRALLRGESPGADASAFTGYDLRFFENVGRMRDEILARDEEDGLARLVAGYAWEWKSKKDKAAYDIELDGVGLRWNSTDTDWINSPNSLQEVGSIHTVQGYDLNYAGVIIGPELRYDVASGRLFVDREAYRDGKGKENNPKLGIEFDDDDLLVFIRNIYGVLLTRGMRGTYVYVCDPALREHLRPYFTR